MNFSKTSNWTKTIVMFLATMTIVSCKDTKNKTEATPAEEVKETTGESARYISEKETSILTWKGFKVGESHHGTIQISDGYFDIVDGKLSAGKFAIDMNTIKNLDIEDAGYNKKLIDHLKSPDFFDVENNSGAIFEITAINEEVGMSMIKGNLTIKGIQKNIEFPASISVEGDKLVFKSEPFTIDRTEWGIKFHSGKFFDNLKDKLIKDEIEFTVKITAKKS